MKQFIYNVAFASGKLIYGFVDSLDLEIAYLEIENLADLETDEEDLVSELQVIEYAPII